MQEASAAKIARDRLEAELGARIQALETQLATEKARALATDEERTALNKRVQDLKRRMREDAEEAQVLTVPIPCCSDGI